eukprot:scaffold20120_cov133-Cylindrotheca_fusiformis.AAC.1
MSRPERTPEIWEQRNKRKFEGNYDTTLTKWFPEFIKLMRRNESDDGMALAYRLAQAINVAYAEMNLVEYRITELNETVAPLYEWDDPLATDSENWQGRGKDCDRISFTEAIDESRCSFRCQQFPFWRRKRKSY